MTFYVQSTEHLLGVHRELVAIHKRLCDVRDKAPAGIRDDLTSAAGEVAWAMSRMRVDIGQAVLEENAPVRRVLRPEGAS